MMTSEPRKLAFVLPEYGVHTHFRYVGEFAHALSQKIDIVLVLEKGGHPPEFPIANIRTQQFHFPPLRFLEMGWMLFSLHRQGYRTQYVHYSFVAGFWSALWVKLLGGSMYYWNAGMPWLYRRGLLRETFERMVFRMIDHLITGADALHEGYAKYYGIARERIVTLPNWIDVQGVQAKCALVDKHAVRERLHIPPDAQVLLFVHRLAKRKGAHLLPDLLAKLAEGGRVLVIAGDGPERAWLEAEFNKRGLMERVRMLGWVAQDEVHELYAIADLFLLPSEEEGFPHVLTEAQAAGLPYVASDVGGVREMTPPEGGVAIVPYGDVLAFTTAAHTLLTDKAVYQRFQEAERMWVLRYDKSRIVERFLALVFPEK